MSSVDRLQQYLREILPTARLVAHELPDCPAIRLWLLNADYPQGDLDPQQVQRVMDNPLYWVFCWASGQVLADFILRNPQWVAGRRVIDFGCGSGVVAIAAVLAGAAEVIACDSDPYALAATQANAQLNGVALSLAHDYDAIDVPVDLIIVADVLYDRANFHWPRRFARDADQVLIADSRVKDFNLPPYRQIAHRRSCTVPDLAESPEFREVRIYLAGTDK